MTYTEDMLRMLKIENATLRNENEKLMKENDSLKLQIEISDVNQISYKEATQH